MGLSTWAQTNHTVLESTELSSAVRKKEAHRHLMRQERDLTFWRDDGGAPVRRCPGSFREQKVHPSRPPGSNQGHQICNCKELDFTSNLSELGRGSSLSPPLPLNLCVIVQLD